MPFVRAMGSQGEQSKTIMRTRKEQISKRFRKDPVRNEMFKEGSVSKRKFLRQPLFVNNENPKLT